MIEHAYCHECPEEEFMKELVGVEVETYEKVKVGIPMTSKLVQVAKEVLTVEGESVTVWETVVEFDFDILDSVTDSDDDVPF